MNDQTRSMIDFAATPLPLAESESPAVEHPRLLGILKRCFDILVAVLAAPVVLGLAACLVLVNPVWNPGPLFFRQVRMGRGCRPFTLIKFRSMSPCPEMARGPTDPVETDRITPIGRWLRRTRLDELPQFFNVLRGDMSVVGPRPDFWDHAIHYADIVPDYRLRYRVRPGITGLAQVDGGYAEGIEEIFEKTRHDLDYLTRSGFRMEGYVLWRTALVMLTGFGAR